MRLAEFILANIEPILAEWEDFARSLSPGADMTIVQLRDDAQSILLATARDMQNRQSLEQQESKSKGDGGAGGAASDRLDIASDMHGVERVSSGFHITDVVSEYRALRASVLRLWRESVPQPERKDLDDLTRFNESLDQSLARGVASYSKRVDDSRQMFLAILSHDLRNPLSTIRTAAYLVAMNNEDRATADAILMINRSTDVMVRLISDLIDFSSSGLGRAMPLNREPVDLELLCREVIDAYRTTHADRVLHFHSDGDVNGVWDVGRIRQVVSNLLGNAIQHGSPDGPITLSATSKSTPSAASGPADAVVALSVHNEGPPIPPDLLPTLFDPLKRYATQESAADRTPGSIGLGLYIVREIVAANGGRVSVTSTAEEGTTFTVFIPRLLPAEEQDRDDAKAAG
ncbi:MAG: HAMP domain-containing sensor histidine kinase [Pseudomonadota bacterium]